MVQPPKCVVLDATMLLFVLFALCVAGSVQDLCDGVVCTLYFKGCPTDAGKIEEVHIFNPKLPKVRFILPFTYTENDDIARQVAHCRNLPEQAVCRAWENIRAKLQLYNATVRKLLNYGKCSTLRKRFPVHDPALLEEVDLDYRISVFLEENRIVVKNVNFTVSFDPKTAEVQTVERWFTKTLAWCTAAFASMGAALVLNVPPYKLEGIWIGLFFAMFAFVLF